MKRRSLGAVVGTVVAALSIAVDAAKAQDWTDIVERARGQTVFFHAWAGDTKINDYIDWVGDQTEKRWGVEVRHVKISDTGETVGLVLAEKAAGRTDGGRVDLIWINGENFNAMKSNGLLFGPFAPTLPNFALVDTENKPTTLIDFTVPTDGLESPWGMAQLVFYHDTARGAEPPRSISALPDWLEDHPGRFTYPAPPDFTGISFLKQALISLAPDPAVLQSPATAETTAAATAPLWDYLDRLHPLLWREGRGFPTGYADLRQLVDDGEIDIAFAFNPGEASSAIAQGLLPDTVRSFVLNGGMLANTHFVAIPFNANAKEGAMVVANFLLSPEAQARKADPAVWGDPTVLAVDRLKPEDRALFDALPRGIATLPPDALGPALPEPHPSWVGVLEAEWLRRYSR